MKIRTFKHYRKRWDLRQRRFRREVALRLRGSNPNSLPVFILGKQRSGTNMLISVLERAPVTHIFNEDDTRAFDDYVLRDFDTLARRIQDSGGDVVIFKAISDTHHFPKIASRFPGANFIFIYRNYQDNANSAITHWGGRETRAIRLVANNQPGGGWFQAGVSEAIAEQVRALDSAAYSQHTWAALAWWARNMLCFELGLAERSNVMLIDYDDLAQNAAQQFPAVFAFLELDFRQEYTAHVFGSSVRKRSFPEIDPAVRAMCEALTERLHDAKRRNKAMHEAQA